MPASVHFDAAPEGGWFTQPPSIAEEPGIGSAIWLLTLPFIEVPSIAAAVELVAGTLKRRPPGMRVGVIPLCAWDVRALGRGDGDGDPQLRAPGPPLAHHGAPAISPGFFSAASEGVAIPTGIPIFAILATPMVGHVRPTAPMLWRAGAIAWSPWAD